MTMKNPTPKAGATGFLMRVMPDHKHLDKAIADDGFCKPAKCWHKVGGTAILHGWGETNPRLRVDAGHFKFNYKGYRYVADTPRHVKRSLMLFDLKRYNEVVIREYSLRCRRVGKLQVISRERQEQVEAARRARVAAGGTERKRVYPTMRDRVKGHSISV